MNSFFDDHSMFSNNVFMESDEPISYKSNPLNSMPSPTSSDKGGVGESKPAENMDFGNDTNAGDQKFKFDATNNDASHSNFFDKPSDTDADTSVDSSANSFDDSFSSSSNDIEMKSDKDVPSTSSMDDKLPAPPTASATPTMASPSPTSTNATSDPHDISIPSAKDNDVKQESFFYSRSNSSFFF